MMNMSGIPVALIVLTNDAQAEDWSDHERDGVVGSYSQATAAARPIPSPVVIRQPLMPIKDNGMPVPIEKIIHITAVISSPFPLPSVAGP